MKNAAKSLASSLALLLLFFLLAGCAGGKKTTDGEPTPARQKPGPDKPWGYFSGPVETRWDEDGVNMILLNELRYTDPNGEIWIAPAGARVNGASIPKAFWSLIGGPFEGKYRNASVLHDVAYEEQSRPWQEVDLMFYHAMRASGVGVVKAKSMYYALYRHGHHWKHPRRKAIPVDPTLELAAPRATAVDPADVDAIQKWIEENDPSIGQIEARAAGSPR